MKDILRMGWKAADSLRLVKERESLFLSALDGFKMP